MIIRITEKNLLLRIHCKLNIFKFFPIHNILLNNYFRPLKEDFIRAKHRQQLFILKSSDTREDLNQQLHSSVRTSNLETSLRILAQGADPNYYHPVIIHFVVYLKNILFISLF